MRRAQVLDWGLQEQLWPHMEALRPRPSVYIPEFIAANQSTRADNLIPGTRAQQLEQIRKDICDFRSRAGLDKIIVLWTANTERFCELVPGLNDTAENLLRTIQVGVLRGGAGSGPAPKEPLRLLSACAHSWAWRYRPPRSSLWPASWRAAPSSMGRRRTPWCQECWSLLGSVESLWAEMISSQVRPRSSQCL